MSEKITLTSGSFTVDAAASDGQPSRSITGLAVPWNVATTDSLGTKVMFKAGSLPEDGRPPRLLESHDPAKVRGLVTERVSTDEGMMFTAKLAQTSAADDTMALLLMGAYDSVSVGVVPTKFSFDNDGTMVVEAAKWSELSIVAEPAFDAARIEKVAASALEEAPDEDPTPETTSEEEIVETPEVVEAATVPTQPIQFAQPAKPFTFPSAAEWISKALVGGAEFAEFDSKIKAAAPDVVTTDTPGILPEPIVGAVYNNYLPNWRPLVNAMGVKAMPGGGKIFRRPEVTTHTTIGASNGENVALDQGTFVVSDNQVTKQVFGGYVRLSEEDMDWTQPEVLGLIIDDMARIYANQTDAYACAQFEAGVTQTATLTSATDPADWASFVYAAAKEILENSNGNLPNVLIMDPLYFSALGALADQDGRPLFPTVGPMNAFGSLTPGNVNATAFGLQVVVDKNLVVAGGNNLYVGDSSGFEIYEQSKGAISVEAADGSLSRYIKFRGYFATLMIDATKFVARG
jgi:HK97 family phage prohead protease/HK97 family phage major capsid protein